jgi:hydrogenase large subunit
MVKEAFMEKTETTSMTTPVQIQSQSQMQTQPLTQPQTQTQTHKQTQTQTQTQQKNKTRTITIDPVTRISGFLDITTEVEDNIVVNAKTSGLLFRGFEKMLKGRAPFDAIYFTERICGICSTSHATASALALENALKIIPKQNDLYLRDLIHGFEFLQNHLRQFYFFTLPDYVKLLDVNPISPQEFDDYRLSEAQTKGITDHYIAVVEYSRLAHEGLSVLGGKAPHNHGIFVGGVTVNIDSYKLEKIKSILAEIKSFVNNFMIEDMNTLASCYSDYFEKGNSYNHFMTYGLFHYLGDPSINYVAPGVMIDGKRSLFDGNNITENIRSSWYKSDEATTRPGDVHMEEVDLSKPEAYSFIKSPRYKGMPMEGGPLARLMISGEYTRGNSCMDRNMARVLETKKIVQIMENIIERIELGASNQEIYVVPDSAFGVGLTDTIRGCLGHWVQIENKVIKNYDLITPTGWNLSPLDSNGFHGPAEKALIGTTLDNVDSPVELGRIIRSFDPCVSCATHVIRSGLK